MTDKSFEDDVAAHKERQDKTLKKNVAVGVGSAAIVAALIYANRRKRK